MQFSCKISFLSLLTISIGFIPAKIVSANHFQGLGDLPGGSFYSEALGISADGSTVVGTSHSANGMTAFIWDHIKGMASLGDLPKGGVHSEAWKISADVSTVVGTGFSVNGYEAFIWSKDRGLIGLGDLSGGTFSSNAYGVSADGSIIVGTSHSANGEEAFIWHKTYGMRAIKDMLENDFNLDLAGWSLFRAMGISADGSVVIGHGKNPDGKIEAWIVKFDSE